METGMKENYGVETKQLVDHQIKLDKPSKHGICLSKSSSVPLSGSLKAGVRAFVEKHLKWPVSELQGLAANAKLLNTVIAITKVILRPPTLTVKK